MRKILTFILILTLSISSISMGANASTSIDKNSAPTYINGALSKNFVKKEGPNCDITLEDVVKYNDVEGDDGILVTFKPILDDGSFTNGYVYTNIPVSVLDASVTLKMIAPGTTQAEFNDIMQWWTVGFNQKPNTDVFAPAAKSVTYMMWGQETKLFTNGYWEGEDKLSMSTDWGAFPSIGEHTYGIKQDETEKNNFVFQADNIFPAQANPYLGTQTKTGNNPQTGKAYALSPYNMHVSDFKDNEAYLTIGVAMPATADKNLGEVKMLIKHVKIPQVFPEGIQIGNGTITSVEKNIGEKFTLPFVFSPNIGVTEKDVVWATTNEAVATVNATTGEITAIAKGSCEISVTTVNNKSAKITLNVVEKVEEKPEPTPEEKSCGSMIKETSNTLGVGMIICCLLVVTMISLTRKNKKGENK